MNDETVHLDLDNLPELLTVKEVASIFRISKLTVKRWEHSRGLIPIRINSRGDRRYKRELILKMLGEAESNMKTEESST